MRVKDGQSDFTGGMNDRLSPERLAPNQYSEGKNIEFRYGGVRSRRGSWLRLPNAVDTAGDVLEVTGSCVLRSTVVGGNDTFIYSAYRSDTDTTNIYRVIDNGIGVRSEIATPEVMIGKVPVVFIQAYDTIVAIREGDTPWYWDGDYDNPFLVIPEGSSGGAPKARDGLYAYNRLWFIEGDDTVIPSDLLDTNWDRTDNEFRIERGDGTRLVALQPFGGGSLLAFKERGISLVLGANNFITSSDLVSEFIDEKVGCIAAKTIVSVGADVFFLGREGVWSIQQTTEQNARLVDVPLSDPINGLINDINWQHATSACAANYDSYYLLAVPTGGSIYPNRILVYDLISQSWVGYWEFAETQSDTDDGLFTFQSLLLSKNSNQINLNAISGFGSLCTLFKGEYEDLISSSRVWTEYFITTTSDALTIAPAGEVEVYVKAAQDGLLDGTILAGKIEFNLIQASSSDPVTIDFTVNEGLVFGGDPMWSFSYNTTALSDGEWHVIKISHTTANLDSSLVEYPVITIDGVQVGETTDFTITSSLRHWNLCSDLFSDYKDTYVSIDGIAVDQMTINRFSSGAYTGNELFLFDEGSGDDTVKIKFSQIGSPVQSTITAADTAVWGTDGGLSRASNIDSKLVTRGMSFGSLLSQKSAVRGEIRFSHGQPTITASIKTDRLFDTDTVASLTAKTYSLTDYEVFGRSAWVNDNSNNDFATPGREDYAPVDFGVQLLSNGVVLDKHREHTEFFSSMVVFDWIQFVLENTTGFIRYNNISLESNARELQQDQGNNGN